MLKKLSQRPLVVVSATLLTLGGFVALAQAELVGFDNQTDVTVVDEPVHAQLLVGGLNNDKPLSPQDPETVLVKIVNPGSQAVEIVSIGAGTSADPNVTDPNAAVCPEGSVSTLASPATTPANPATADALTQSVGPDKTTGGGTQIAADDYAYYAVTAEFHTNGDFANDNQNGCLNARLVIDLASVVSRPVAD